MANEILTNGSLCLTDGTSPTQAVQSGDVLDSLTTHRAVRLVMIADITPTAVPVATLTSPGWALFLNRDATNYVDLYTDNGVNKKAFARIPPGGKPCGPIFLGTDAKAPYMLANTAACQVEILVLDT